MSKHYFIKTHKSHMWILNLILLFLFIGALIAIFGYRPGLFDFIIDDPMLFTNALLLILVVSVLIQSIIILYFFIELKDSVVKEEEEVIREEKAILKRLGKKGKRQRR